MSKKTTNDEKLCLYDDLEKRQKYNNEFDNKFKTTRRSLVLFLCRAGDNNNRNFYSGSPKYHKIKKMIDEYDDIILDILYDLCETSQIDNMTRDLEKLLEKYTKKEM